MKQLTLVRHAQAESALPDQEDFDRVLTRRGAEDAAEMSRRLKLLKLHIDYVVSSPAPRAWTTAEIFARALKLPSVRMEKDDRLYTAGPSEYLKIIHECGGDHHHVLIAGHNPGITEFADKLSAERRIDAMPTCAVVTLQFDVLAWTDLAWHTGGEVELDYPARIS